MNEKLINHTSTSNPSSYVDYELFFARGELAPRKILEMAHAIGITFAEVERSLWGLSRFLDFILPIPHHIQIEAYVSKCERILRSINPAVAGLLSISLASQTNELARMLRGGIHTVWRGVDLNISLPEHQSSLAETSLSLNAGDYGLCSDAEPRMAQSSLGGKCIMVNDTFLVKRIGYSAGLCVQDAVLPSGQMAVAGNWYYPTRDNRDLLRECIDRREPSVVVSGNWSLLRAYSNE